MDGDTIAWGFSCKLPDSTPAKALTMSQTIWPSMRCAGLRPLTAPGSRWRQRTDPGEYWLPALLHRWPASLRLGVSESTSELGLWLCHSDARQVSDLPKITSIN